MLLCKLLADQAGSANIVAGHPSEFRQELCAIIIDGTYTYISVIDTAWRESIKHALSSDIICSSNIIWTTLCDMFRLLGAKRRPTLFLLS